MRKPGAAHQYKSAQECVTIEPAFGNNRIKVFSGILTRMAQTAKLNDDDTAVNPERCKATANRGFDLFPATGRRDTITLLTKLRPSIPSNAPIIGRRRYPNLYLNTGHDKLGEPMACGAGLAIATSCAGARLGLYMVV